MKYKFHENELLAGIYKIQNLSNQRIYIGSAVRFKNRWTNHLNALKANRHENMFLQADFNKLGKDAFKFEILEITNGTKEERLKIEERYILQFFGDYSKCYNLSKRAISPAAPSKTPEATKQKRSKSAKINWQTIEYRQKITSASKKALLDKAISHTFISPTGELTEVKHIIDFAKEKNLDCRGLYELVSGKAESYKGWRSSLKYSGVFNLSEQLSKSRTIKYTNISIISNDGIILTGPLYEVANEAKLKKASLAALIRGDKESLYGWKSHSKKEISANKIKKQNSCEKEYFFISPSGQVHSGVGIGAFAKTVQLKVHGFYKLISGECKSYKGWKLYSPIVTHT